MYGKLRNSLQNDLDAIKSSGLYKEERIITSSQGAEISTINQSKVLNFCANNYLGLASDERVKQAAIDTIKSHGFGLSSVRFICGTQDIHKQLEKKTAEFLGMEDCILYAAAFDANGGLFEPLLNSEDTIITDELNHASIIDGIRLCKAKRFRYRHNNMSELENQLKLTSSRRRVLIVIDGSFSMDETLAQLDEICNLADKYNALVMIDECHSTGFIGKKGRGSHENHNVMDRIDIITGTYGKALGGASGGFTAARKEIVDILRQHSRPYLFSNSVAPAIVGATLEVLNILSSSTDLRDKLEENTEYFRSEMTASGFDIVKGFHPIVPIMLHDAAIAQKFAKLLLEEGIYVVGFFFPVVPKGKARIRVQLSAVHERAHIDKAVEAFVKIGKQLKVID